MIASSLILKKKPSKIQVIGIAVTLAGVLITVFVAGMSASLSVAGYAFLALAVISYALYSVFVDKASAFSEAEITFMMLAAGAAVFVAAAIAKIGVNRTSSFIGASTVVSVLAGVLFLQEKLSFGQIVGALIIVIGIYTANIKKASERPANKCQAKIITN